MTFGKKTTKEKDKEAAKVLDTEKESPVTTPVAPSAAKDSPAPVSGGKRAIVEFHPTRGYAVVTEGTGPSFKVAYHIRRTTGTPMVAPIKGGVSVTLDDYLSGKANLK